MVFASVCLEVPGTPFYVDGMATAQVPTEDKVFSEAIHPMKVLSGCGDPDDIILGHHYRQGNVKSSLSARQCHLLDWGKLFSRIGPYLYIYLVNLCQYPECKPRFFLFGDRFHDFLEWGTIH